MAINNCLYWESTAEIHHIVPVSEGGVNTIENLVALCHDCHVAIHQLRRTWQWWIAADRVEISGAGVAANNQNINQIDMFGG